MNSYGSILSVDQQDESGEPLETSRYKCIVSQCCGVLASNCLKFTASTFSGFHIILIAELHKENSEIDVTLDELTWIASLNFLVPIGSIANGIVAQRLGSRLIMLSASLSFVLIWLIYHSARSVPMVLAGRILYSLTSGALKTPASAYITEISEPRMRGSFLATYHLAGTFGTFFSLLMGSLLYWRTVALINIAFPLISLVVVHFIPDSPTWLASKGRFDDARAALSWLRGWVEPSNVGTEYQTLIENVQQSQRSSSPGANSSPEKLKRRGEEPPGGWLERLKAGLGPFGQRSFYAPLGAVSLIYFLHYFSGVSAIQVYSMVLFAKMRSPIAVPVATALMGGMRVLGAFIVLLSIQRAGKKRLVLLSLVIAGGAYLAIAGCGGYHLGDPSGDPSGDPVATDPGPAPAELWLPPIALILAVFANAAGAETIVQMLNSEIFPVSIRYIGSAIGVSIGSIIQSAMSKIFLYLVDALTLPGVFLYFACMNVLASLVYRRIFPETEGRSLEEIEEHYRGGRDLSEPVNFSKGAV